MKKYLYLICLIAGLSFTSAVLAEEPTERERALEERVGQLERLVEQLMQERQQPAAAPAQTPIVQALEERVDKLEAEKAPRVTGDPKATFSYGGFVKTDVNLSRYSAGSAPPRGLIRDFYVPALVPVGGDSSTTDIDYHMRESRFWFKTETEAAGKPLSGYLEFDFSAATGGDERLTNATSPSIRHAFLKYGNLLVGQTWSNFFNVGALAENLDFVGPAEGTLFIRQPLIQYTAGNWQFAAENPETTVTPFGGGARIVTDTSHIPDLSVRYTARGDWGHFAIAGLGRQLAIDGPGGTSRKAAFGLSLSGLFKVGASDDFRWMLNGGPGIGRYLGLNTANDAVLDEDGDLDPIKAYGGFVSYRHFWSPQWRSNFTLSAFRADNDTDLTGLGPTKRAESAHANLIYQLSPQLRFGIEYIHARREVEAGDKGNMNRMQFSAIYAF